MTQIQCNNLCNFLILSGKERNRSQGLRAIIGLKRDNADDLNHGVVATQTGEMGMIKGPYCDVASYLFTQIVNIADVNLKLMLAKSATKSCLIFPRC